MVLLNIYDAFKWRIHEKILSKLININMHS